MQAHTPADVVEEHETCRGRTLIELRREADGEWTATQHGLDVIGTGGTAPAAALDYCRQITEAQNAE